jgi:6-pyruvoyl-tetrahydropterin synthase
MKKLLFILSIFFISIEVSAQSFNEDKTAFTNYVKRMYASAPFDGVKIIEDYDHQYLVSVIGIDKAKYTDPSVMNRVAQVKAQSQVNTYLNGASIDMNTIIRTTETTENNQTKSVTESIEQIKQNSTGFSQGLELLTNFQNSDSKKMVYVYMREIKK